MIIEYQDYQIKPSKEYPNNMIIVTAGRGGKIPNVLAGLFTDVNQSKNAIDRYLESKKKD